MAMAEVSGDVIEQILIRLDVEDLIRCKCVCKSWLSLISTPHLVKSHLRHHNTPTPSLGYTRFCSYIPAHTFLYCNWLYVQGYFIVGSSNGLVCLRLSPSKTYTNPQLQFLVTNPCTRQQTKLPPHKTSMRIGCWGFGYDSSADDYKVITGFMFGENNFTTLFHVFTLKGCNWQVIGQVDYSMCDFPGMGVLCVGALHWLMTTHNNRVKVIVSLDLSTHEFKQIPLPDECDDPTLGVVILLQQECLCIFSAIKKKKWVMMKSKNKWEVYNDESNKYDYVAHGLTRKSGVYGLNVGTRVPNDDKRDYYIHSSIYVKSLVSPHLQGQGSNVKKKKKGNIKKKRRTRSVW